MGRPEHEERACECGCGERFRARVGDNRRRFVNTVHANRARRRDNGVQPADVRAADKLRTAHKNQAEELTRTRAALARATRERDELQGLLDRFATVKPADQRVPTWLKPPTPSPGEHHRTAVLLLSDLHLDEVVDKWEMDGVNEYNREVAERRLSNVVNGTVKLLKHYTANVVYDGIVVAMLGDVLTGVIHDELARTNEAPPSASIVHWVPRLASALRHLADEFGRVHVPCVDGNHDRFYKQTPAKQRTESSLAWVIYNWLADTLRDDARITFGISTSPEQLVSVYGTTLLLSHGDAFKSQGGVGGLYPSMLKWLLRRHQFYSSVSRDFDLACMGHWHHGLYGDDFVVNNTMKGYDEYARFRGFTFTPPSQLLFDVSPERGIVQRLEVNAEDG